MKAKRLEDLGRIREKLENILCSPLLRDGISDKETFIIKCLNAQTDDFQNMHEQIADLKAQLLQCLTIAKGSKK